MANKGIAEPAAVPPNVKPAPGIISAGTIKELLNFYRSLWEEYDYFLPEDLIDGEIPPELEGTLFRNGPGSLEIFGKKINQPFDGDGMISRFSFSGGKAHFSNRYVRTEGFLEEQEQGRMIYQGAFATDNPQGTWFRSPLDFIVKNVANTGVLQWGGKLWALHESGLPYELDAKTLNTIGESDMDGSISGKGPFAAHYRIMHQPDGSRRWVTFGSAVKGLDAEVTFYEYAEDGKLVHKTAHKIKGGAFAFFHDIVVTERHYILLQNPTRMNFRKLLLEYPFGKCAIAECVQYDESLPAKALLVPRPGASATSGIQSFDMEPFFSFHHVNAFEEAGRVVIDTIGWNTISFKMNMDSLSPEYFQGGQRSELQRLVIDTASGSVSRRSLSHRCCEFSTVNPRFNGQPYRHLFVPAAAVDHPVYWGPNQVLAKVSFPAGQDAADAEPQTELWAPGPHCFVQEPLFVPRPGGTEEDDGWVLVLVNNGESERTDLAILDGRRIADGPVCTLHLPHHIPPGLHGSWSEEFLGPQPPAQLPQQWQPSFSTIKH